MDRGGTSSTGGWLPYLLRVWLAALLIALGPGMDLPPPVLSGDGALLLSAGEICSFAGGGEHDGQGQGQGQPSESGSCLHACCLGPSPLPPLPAATPAVAPPVGRGEVQAAPYRLAAPPLVQARAVQPRGPPARPPFA